jgi:ABC-type amino acid transport substrate-binding protein
VLRRSALLALALLATALIPPPDALAQAGPGALDRIRREGRLVLGYRSDARPLAYRDEAGNPSGYSVELCARVADAVKGDLGLPSLAVEWVPVSVDARLDAIRDRKVDLLCGAETVTLSRRTVASFSIPVFPGGIGALVRADAPERLRKLLAEGRPAVRPSWRASPSQILERRTFSAISGTTGEKWLRGRIDAFRITATVALVDGYDAGVKGVVDRRADAFFADRALLLDAARRSAAARELVVLDRHFTQEPIAFAMQRGDEDFRLVVDRAVSRALLSGDARAVYVKWFGDPDEAVLAFFRNSALPD